MRESKNIASARLLNNINSIQQDESKAHLPSYTSYMARGELGESVLSIFGGADVSPLAVDGVSNLYIVDLNPFTTKESALERFRDHLADDDKDGLFHQELAEALMSISPSYYGTMRAGQCDSDFSSPYELLGMAMSKGREFATEGLVGAVERGQYEEGRFKVAELGISTTLLYRIRKCLNAEVTGIHSLDDHSYKIDITKENGEKASIIYSSCTLGGKQDPAKLATLKQAIESTGLQSVFVRGFPNHEVGDKHEGEMVDIKRDLINLVGPQNNPDWPSLRTVVCNNTGQLPPMFNYEGEALESIEGTNLVIGSNRTIAGHLARLTKASPATGTAPELAV